MKKFAHYTVIIILICFSACKSKQANEIVVFDAPDQVLWHAATQTWFVSNLGGGISLKKDGYGWITRLDKNGNVLTAQWIKNLDAPSGMISTNKYLFVCDRTGVYQINIEKATIEKEFLLPEAEFVNDIVISPAGDLYVSDFFGNKIFRIPAETRKPEVFLNLNESPDGLYMDNDTLVIATWGKISNKNTFETSKKGKILLVDTKTKQVRPLLSQLEEIGNLEGITKSTDGAYFVTDWASGKLLKVTSS